MFGDRRCEERRSWGTINPVSLLHPVPAERSSTGPSVPEEALTRGRPRDAAHVPAVARGLAHGETPHSPSVPQAGPREGETPTQLQALRPSRGTAGTRGRQPGLRLTHKRPPEFSLPLPGALGPWLNRREVCGEADAGPTTRSGEKAAAPSAGRQP